MGRGKTGKKRFSLWQRTIRIRSFTFGNNAHAAVMSEGRERGDTGTGRRPHKKRKECGSAGYTEAGLLNGQHTVTGLAKHVLSHLAVGSSAEPAVPDARMGQASEASSFEAMGALASLAAGSIQHCCLSLSGTYCGLGFPKQIQQFMKRE